MPIPGIGAVGWFLVHRVGIRGGLFIAGAALIAILWWRLDATADARDRARAEAQMLRVHIAEQAAALRDYADALSAAEERARQAEARVTAERRRARQLAASGAPTASQDAAEIAAELLRQLGRRE